MKPSWRTEEQEKNEGFAENSQRVEGPGGNHPGQLTPKKRRPPTSVYGLNLDRSRDGNSPRPG